MDQIKQFVEKWQNFDWRDVRVHLKYDETVKEMSQDLTNLVESAVKEERERCAKIAENYEINLDWILQNMDTIQTSNRIVNSMKSLIAKEIRK